MTENKHYVKTRNMPPSNTYIYMGLGNLFFAPKVLVTIFTRKYDE